MKGSEVLSPMEAARRNIDALGINYDALPKLPRWAFLFGNTEAKEDEFKFSVAAGVMLRSSLLGRKLSQPEKDALAYYEARKMATAAWMTPIAIPPTVAGLQMTRAKFGFPFWTPKPDKFNPNNFFGLVQGPAAPSLWHGLRTAAWYCVCRFGTGLFIFSYARHVYARNVASDPRLKNYRRDMDRRLRGVDRQQSHPGLRATEEPSDAWPNTEQTTEQNAQAAQSPWPETQTSQPEAASDPFKADEPYEFDDASPVAPQEQQKGASQPPVQEGSAWDRLRKQQAGSVAAGQGSTRQTSAWTRKREDEASSRGAHEGTSFSYSSGDEEKSYAKEQAQKEFDEMLEKERRGKTSGRQ